MKSSEKSPDLRFEFQAEFYESFIPGLAQRVAPFSLCVPRSKDVFCDNIWVFLPGLGSFSRSGQFVQSSNWLGDYFLGRCTLSLFDVKPLEVSIDSFSVTSGKSSVFDVAWRSYSISIVVLF